MYQYLVTEFDDLVIMIKSLTDDIPSFFRPEEGTGEQGWHNMYDRMHQLLKRYDQANWLTPLVTTLVVSGGVKISGRCFGTDQDAIAHGLAKVKAIQPRIDGIVALGIVNAHAAMCLLGYCANKALDYYLRIAPPALSAPAAEAF